MSGSVPRGEDRLCDVAEPKHLAVLALHLVGETLFQQERRPRSTLKKPYACRRRASMAATIDECAQTLLAFSGIGDPEAALPCYARLRRAEAWNVSKAEDKGAKLPRHSTSLTRKEQTGRLVSRMCYDGAGGRRTVPRAA